MVTLGFKARMDRLASVFCHLRTIYDVSQTKQSRKKYTALGNKFNVLLLE